MESFAVVTRSRTELVDITDSVRAVVNRSGVKSGMCHVCIPHTTAGVTVNEAYDPDVATDITKALDRLVPAGAGYAHSEGNADAHVKATLVGHATVIPVEDGSLRLGRWQGVFFCEFDGPRHRTVEVKLIPDNV